MPTDYTYIFKCAEPGDGAFEGCGWTYSNDQRQWVRREARKHRLHQHGEVYTFPAQLDALIHAVQK